ASTTGFALGSPGLLIVGDSLSGPSARCSFSSDKTNWTEFTLPFENRPSDVNYVNGEFLLVGDGGLIAHSSDGTNWHSKTTGPQPSVRCVTSSPERIISL